MSTEIIVRFCAPTLAGLKVGNLFSYRYRDYDDAYELMKMLAEQNHKLNPKGVYFVLVKLRGGIALVYVYRRRQLEELLKKQSVQHFLREYGYHRFDIPSCLAVLKKRLLLEDFPHDIGVFLGYPLMDIQAFIENKGANCPCVGCWKAYTNLSEAKKKFRRFKQCTEIYCQQYFDGIDITRLTVAG